MGETETASTDDVSNILTRIDYENEEDIERLRTIFLKYSTYQDENDDWMINVEDFFNRFLGVVQYGEDKKINRQTLKILSRTVNCNEDGYISFDEFKNFEQLLSRPDAIFEIAFRLFDIDRSQSISFEEFKRVLSHTNLHSLYPFNFSSEFVHLHFGEGNNLRRLRYKGFTQLLVDLHEEHSIQAFRRVLLENRQLDNTSYSISSEQLHDLLIKSQPHLMSDWLSENLTELNCPTDGKDEDDQVSFVWYFSLISLLRNTELLRRIFERSFKSENFSGIDDYSIKKDDFLSCALQFPQISPLQIDILFRIAQLRRTGNSTISSSSSSSSSGTGTITTSSGTVITPPHSNSQTTLNLSDIRAITPLTEDDMPFRKSARRHFEQQQQQQHHQTYWQKASESVYRFVLGSIAGACGATAVYPIDLVKTRMQNQRSFIGEVMYRNSMDCFKKVLKYEGIFGLYRGLLPQIIGVAPEKAIKLTTNDFCRDYLRNKKDGSIPLLSEVVSGGCAGFSQVIFTNPLEIVKIRLQVAGEIATVQRPSALNVVKDLGFRGLYKGAKACFLRDIPFSAIYFPAYAHTKQILADDEGKNSPFSLLVAGAIAGMPAASLVTPADVIKTRLQVVARQGQTKYDGVIDATKKIIRQEGFAALWKGTVARVFRSSPQFAVTLFTYEILQRTFNVDFGGRPLSGTQKEHDLMTQTQISSPNHDHIGSYRLAPATFASLESKFGINFPQTE